MSINPQESIEKRIITRAKEDPEFKQRLLRNAKEVFEQELGQKLPESVEIVALQQSSQKLYITLPMNRDELAPELSEEELEAVSGGTGVVCATISLTGIITQEYNCFL